MINGDMTVPSVPGLVKRERLPERPPFSSLGPIYPDLVGRRAMISSSSKTRSER